MQSKAATILGFSLMLGLAALGFLVRQMAAKFKEYERVVNVKGLAEQEVADQNAGLIAPDGAGCVLATAQIALVDHVVMQKRCRVHELDGGRQLDVMLALVAEHRGGRQSQHRPQPLAAR